MRRRRRRTLVVVATAVLVIVAAGALLWSARTPVMAGTPRLETDRTEIDFGTVPFGHQVTATFKLRNVGDGQLVIEAPPRASVALGC
jgi:hypothetical protein